MKCRSSAPSVIDCWAHHTMICRSRGSTPGSTQARLSRDGRKFPLPIGLSRIDRATPEVSAHADHRKAAWRSLRYALGFATLAETYINALLTEFHRRFIRDFIR